MESPSHPRVVVGVDKTVAGFAALRFAVAQARARRVPLHAIRVVPAVGLYSTEYIAEAFTEALGGVPADLDVRFDLSDEGVAEALAKSARDPRDLIIVGNEGRGALRALWSGSPARRLLRRARCPVLAVPAPEMQRATRRSAHKLAGNRADVWDRFESEVPELRGGPGPRA
jgi:nucleotide-binding universal stress UspA family protein